MAQECREPAENEKEKVKVGGKAVINLVMRELQRFVKSSIIVALLPPHYHHFTTPPLQPLPAGLLDRVVGATRRYLPCQCIM